MAIFSVGGEADEGSSSPRRKRQRILTTYSESSSDEEEHQLSESDSSDEEQESQDEQDVEDDEEEEDYNAPLSVPLRIRNFKPRSSNVAGPDRNSGIGVTLTDPEVLDCSICYESLTIPVFQCENGHTACSSCCKKVANKCPSCTLPIGYNRCRAIEKVLDSVRLPCQNLKYGCREMVTYSKKFHHDKICNHSPCHCPISVCNFVGSDAELYQHFSSKHKGSATKFQFDVISTVFFPSTDKSHILQEEKEGVIFILKNRGEILGNVLTIHCIGPSSNKGYFYQLAAKSEESNLRFQSVTKSSPKVSDNDAVSKEYLVVPGSFFGSYGQISLNLCIWRQGAYPAAILTNAV